MRPANWMPLVGPEACVWDRAGWLLDAGHLQLRLREEANSSSSADAQPHSLNPGALGLSQVQLAGVGGAGETVAQGVAPQNPAVPGPSSAESGRKASLPPPPQLPDAPISGPGVGADSTCAPPVPSRPGPGHSPGPQRRSASSAA
ncbi:uncharacterized protein LOC106997496 [Macaca mulatta]